MDSGSGFTSRPPAKPRREEIDELELEDYDYVVARFETGYSEATHPRATTRLEYEALLNSPSIAAAFTRLGMAILRSGGVAGSWSHADHEFIDISLSYELGYYGMLAYHTPHAIAAGVRIEAIEALHDGREELLTDDERQQLMFIRDVISGTLSPESWKEMAARLGSTRGVVEYVFFILYLQVHVRLHQALEIPGISREEQAALLRDLRAGAFPVPVAGTAGGPRV